MHTTHTHTQNKQTNEPVNVGSAGSVPTNIRKTDKFLIECMSERVSEAAWHFS